MKMVNMHEAKTHLSRLVDEAVAGKPFIIAKAGKAMVRVEAIEVTQKASWLGALEGQFKVPDDFDTMGREEIIQMFVGE